MYIDKRKDRKGNIYYSFSYVCPKTKKRIRLKKSDHPHFSCKTEAQSWAASQEAHRMSEKTKVDLALKWKKQYFNFNTLLAEYIEWYRHRAPRSWKAAQNRLEHYVFRFFLQEKKCGNVSQWQYYFEEFRTWLRDSAVSVRSGRALSYSTKNHCINSLNGFITFLVKHNKLVKGDMPKCDAFPKHLIGGRGHSDLIPDDEFMWVYKNATGDDFSDLWYILRHTGMRINELYSLEKKSLFAGNCKGALKEELDKYGFEVFGYIVLESQAEQKTNNFSKRVPLKSKKSISLKNARTIPVTDKHCWNILAKRYLRVEKLFFEGVSYAGLLSEHKAVYEGSRFSYKSFHCLRHTYSTDLVGKTRSYFLSKAILGHSTLSVMEKYIHIYEQVAMEAQSSEQKIEVIE